MGQARQGHRRTSRWVALVAVASASLAGQVSAGAALEPERLVRVPQAGAAVRGEWLITITPSARADARLRALGARALRIDGAYRLPASRARAAVRAMRRLRVLRTAERNVKLRRQSAFDGRLDQWARGAVMPATLVPSPGASKIGVIDDRVDASHPDVGPITTFVNNGPLAGEHGTQVASAAAGLNQGAGVAGVYPGTRILSYGLGDFSCADVAEGVDAMIEARADVINMSITTSGDCLLMRREVAIATGRSVVVAAAGNEFDQGNPVLYPAAYPHVISVAAVAPDLSSSYFSTANAGVDISAPGESVPVAMPLAFDTQDGSKDGVTLADGTSFAAPMVAGAAALVWTARPKLAPGQLADVLRFSAAELGEPGWDSNFGWGLLQVAAALTEPEPELDPLEPNDGIGYVNGTLFTRPDPYIWRGRGSGRLDAFVDFTEDPLDVYRIQAPGRSKVTITVDPDGRGDPELAAFKGSARSVNGRPLARSRRAAGRTERVTLRNRSRKRVRYYVAVISPSAEDADLNAAYRLSFKRRRL